MKNILAVACLLASIPAFAENNPFDAFVGTYWVVGKPQVTSEGMSYCDHQGFREMTALSIGLKDSVYQADLLSAPGGSQLHSYTQFKEYSYHNEIGSINSAQVIGAGNQAIYIVRNSSPTHGNTLTWSMSKTETGYTLQIEYLISARTGNDGRCSYFANMARQ